MISETGVKIIKREKSVEQILHLARQWNVDGRGKYENIRVPKLGIKGLHVIVNIALTH
jgi:hypothetical protein